MRIACFSFTQRGEDLGKKLEGFTAHSQNYNITHYANSVLPHGVKGIMGKAWEEYEGIIFICATGIAVRLINPYIKDKTEDPAVVVMDDTARFSISLLSGHVGGANRLAELVAAMTGAMTVITTASDNRGIESIDLFAKRNGYVIEDRASMTSLTAMMVNGKKVGFLSEESSSLDYGNLVILNNMDGIDPSIQGLILVTSQLLTPSIPHTTLRPKNINIGVGCRKGMKGVKIIEAIEQSLAEANLSSKSIKAIGTVEVKKDERGIIDAAHHFHCPLRIFSIEDIRRVEDRFQKSQFVKDSIGVYSVSEPVAFLLGGEMIMAKSRHRGITISISKEIQNG